MGDLEIQLTLLWSNDSAPDCVREVASLNRPVDAGRMQCDALLHADIPVRHVTGP